MKKFLLLITAVVAGAMTAGAENEIIELSYIKSTGQQAINTGYIHKASTMVMMGCVIEQNQQRNYEALFGARLSNYHNNAFCFFSRFAGKDVPCFNRSGAETQGSGLPYNRYIEIAAMGQMAAWGTDEDGLIGSVTTSGTADDGVTPMLIFNLNTATTPGGVQIDTSPCCMSLYEFKIYEGDYNLVHSFLPAKKDGVVGLYDKLTGTFYSSITNTPFVAGEEKQTLYPVTIQSNEGGTVELDVYANYADSWVTLTITPDAGYQLKSAEAKDAQGNDVTTFFQFQENMWHLQMPASCVTVKVVFEKLLTGDVNLDGTVDIADAVSVLNAMAGQPVAGDANVNGDYDANGDPVVDIADLVTILNIMAGSGSSSAGDDGGGGDIIGGDDDDDDENKIYDVAEVLPEFPGGTSALMQWLRNNMHYPQAALEAGIQGRVYVRFIIEKDGSITNAEVLRTIDPLLNAEALRLVNAMPKWSPAKVDGKPVRFRYTIPISFQIQ